MKLLLILVCFYAGLFAQDSVLGCKEIISQTQDDSYAWYGIGTSKAKKIQNNNSVEIATKKALENLASKLNTRLESKFSIDTNETIGKRGKFREKASLSASIFTYQEVSDYEIIFSSTCSKKQYMVVVKLDKNTFFRNQEQKIQDQLIKSSRVLSSTTNYNSRLSQIDDSYQSLINLGRVEGSNSNLLEEYSNIQASLKSEYSRLLSDIEIQSSLSESFMYHVKQSPRLTVRLLDKTTLSPISGTDIEIKLSSKSLVLKTNDDGLVEYTLTNDLKLKTPFNIDATVLLKKNIKNHFLFDSNSFSNPVQNLRVETIPLQIQKSIKVDNDFLKEKIRSSFQEIEGNIQKYLKAEFINKSDGLFSLEITCNDIIFNSKEISIDNEENIKTFKVQFTPVITFYNSKDNASLYSYTMSTQKATSFISFDHAYKKATKLINKDFEKIANEIANTIL